MGTWMVVMPAELWAGERLFHHDAVRVPVSPPASGSATVPGPTAPRPAVPSSGPAAGDDVVLVAGDETHAVAVGTVREARDGTLLVRYRRRAFDDPVPVDDLRLAGPVTPLDPEMFTRLADRLAGGGRARRTWLVSLDLPIEAATPAEAVRQFWSYVQELGPAELPAFVSPSGDELAMQAFVLGAETNLDPEEDED